MAALEKKKLDDEACGEMETEHAGYLGSQDTFYVGNMKGVGRFYQQTFVDTYSKIAFAKLYTTKTKAMSPQTNGICERFHKTIFNEFYQVTFRKNLYSTMEELQKDLDDWIDFYNNGRTHHVKMCCGRTPIESV